MLFKENASKLLNISRMTKDEYVQKEEEPEKILNEEIPKAMQIFSGSLSDGYFCDVGSTPLSFLARQVADILVVEHLCTDPAAVGAAILADLSLNKENEQQIRSQLGVSTLKVWKEVKLFLDPRACETEAHKLDNVCVDAECKMSWLRDKHFSVSAKLAMAAWICLLARLVTEVSGLCCQSAGQINNYLLLQSHWPAGWTVQYVREYLQLLLKLSHILLENDQTKLGKKSVLRTIFDDFYTTIRSFQKA